MADMTAELRTLLQHGHIARHRGRSQDALRAFESAAAIARKVGAKEELIIALKGQAQIERDLNQLERAKALYQQAVNSCRKHDDPLLLAHTLRHLADILSDLNAHSEAEPVYREALAFYRANLKTGVLDLANCLRPLALLLEATGKVAEAKETWIETRVLYNALNLRDAVAECEKHLA